MKKAYKDVTKEYNYTRKNYEEVTRNWLARKKVSTGKVIFRKYYVDKHGIKYKVDGKNVVLHPNINEIETAKLICGMFGENIYLNPKINFPNNIRSSDYLWRNQYWDKKIIGKNAKSNLRAVDNSIKRGKEQADYFILEISDCILSNECIIKQAKKIFSTKGREWVKGIMIIKNNIIIGIFLNTKNRG